MRCAGSRATNGCCRPRSGACCVLAGPRRRGHDRRHPLPFDPVYDYSYDGIMRSFEDSLQRLGLARIDILYVHDIGAMQHGDEAHPRADAHLARQRLSRARKTAQPPARCGRSASASTSARCCSRPWSGATGTRSCSPAATPCSNRRRSTICCRNASNAGTSIVVGGPLNSGILAGRDTWNYKTGTARDRRPGQCHRGGLRQPPGAAGSGGIAIPARASGGGGDHSGPAQRRRVPRQCEAAAPSDPGRAVGRSSRRRFAPPARADTGRLIGEVEQMTRKARIAHLAGPNATIQNTPPLVTSNKARAKHGLPPLTNPDGSPARFDVLRAQRLAAPVTVYVEQFSAHPLEADAAELYGPPDGYIDSAGRVHRERQSADDKPVYEVELRPEDGLYPLPYMALQADGAAWEEECAFPGAPEPKARQGFFPDGSRSFEEIDRLQIGEHGTGNLISAQGRDRLLSDPAAIRLHQGSAGRPPHRYRRRATSRPSGAASISSPTSRRTSPPRRRARRWRARPTPSSRSWRAANMTARSGPRAARGSRRRSTGSTC